MKNSGTGVGAGEGVVDGLGVGAYDGAGLGDVVGYVVGLPDGLGVGLCVGRGDGDAADELVVRVREPLEGVAPGQTAVLYVGTRVLGQCTIDRTVSAVPVGAGAPVF